MWGPGLCSMAEPVSSIVGDDAIWGAGRPMRSLRAGPPQGSQLVLTREPKGSLC